MPCSSKNSSKDFFDRYKSLALHLEEIDACAKSKSSGL